MQQKSRDPNLSSQVWVMLQKNTEPYIFHIAAHERLSLDPPWLVNGHVFQTWLPQFSKQGFWYSVFSDT